MTSISSHIVEISPKELPQYCYGDDRRVRADYNRLTSWMQKAKSPVIRSGKSALEVDTYNGFIYIRACFVDDIDHKHTFSVRYTPINPGSERNAGLIPQVECRYLWDGVVNTNKRTFNSFTECLMLELWRFNIDVELADCSRGLRVLVPAEDTVDTLTSMMQITSVSLKPMEWFTSDYTGWVFYPVHRFLTEDLLLKLQDEAREDRWKNLVPANFMISRAADHALLCVEYGEESLYRMCFSIGLKDGGLSVPNIYKYLDIEFEVENLASNSEVHKYVDEALADFLTFARAYMEIAFSYHALFASSSNGFTITVERKWAFNKFCLLLDLFHGLVDSYSAEKPLITSERNVTIRKLNQTVVSDLEIVRDDDSLNIFANGAFKSIYEEPEEVWDGFSCPF